MFHVKQASDGGLEGVWQGSRAGQSRAKARFEHASGGLVLPYLAACFSREAMAAKAMLRFDAPAGLAAVEP